MGYSEGFRKSIVRRLLAPGGPSVSALSAETGISAQSLYNWLSKLKETIEMSDQKRTPEEWSLPEKNEALLAAAALPPEEKGEWLRRKGLHSGHLTLWHGEIQAALKGIAHPLSKEEQKTARKQIAELEKEIRRKDKALAEMTALVMLKKKLQHLLSDEEL